MRAARVPRSAWWLVAVALATPALGANASDKVLRQAIASIPHHLDPARTVDAIDNAVAGTLFDTLYTYDYLARPVRLVPLAAAALPEMSADGREATIRLRPGIRYPSAAGSASPGREMEARDVAFSLMRLMDPAVRSPMQSLIDGLFEGLDALAARARREKRSLDYDAPIAGIVVVDRHTLRVRLARTEHALAFILANPATSIVPRDIVEREGEAFGMHPVGSGPFVVDAIVPGQRLVLKRSPVYRGRAWDTSATAGAEHAALASSMRGKTLPAIDRVELTLVAEPSSWLLALQTGQFDVVPGTRFALERGKLREPLARKGFVMVRGTTLVTEHLYFNMRDPVIGGASTDRIALRRAIAMAFDDDAWIAQFLGGIGFVQPHPVPPGVDGHDASYRNPNRHDAATANALLDRFGYRRGSDGFRSRPDGSPLTLTMLREPHASGLDRAEFMRRTLERIGIRAAFDIVAFSDWTTRMTTCRYQIAISQWALDFPDGSNALAQFHGRHVGTQNAACFANAEFDALYDRLVSLPFGPDRTALYGKLVAILDAQMPARIMPDYPSTLIASPRVQGLAVHPAMRVVYPYVDVAPR